MMSMIKNMSETMKYFKLFGIMTLLICLFACGQKRQENAQANRASEWKTIECDKYSIQYPGDWTLNKSGQMGMAFLLLSKQTSAQDSFSENVNLVIQDLTGLHINGLDQFTKNSEGQIKSMMANSKILGTEKLKKNGTDFQKIVYTGDQGLYKLKFEQYYLIKYNKAFILTLTCELNQFDNYKELGEKIMNTFNLK